MKFLATVTSSALIILSTMVLSEAFAGVAVSIGEPGFYGQIDIGNYPQPQLINPQPVIIGPTIPGYQPIYLRVPLQHRNHWRRYCNMYNACGRPVYFVNDVWYQNVYVPRYRQNRRVIDPPPARPRHHNPPQYDRRPDNYPPREHRPINAPAPY